MHGLIFCSDNVSFNIAVCVCIVSLLMFAYIARKGKHFLFFSPLIFYTIIIYNFVFFFFFSRFAIFILNAYYFSQSFAAFPFVTQTYVLSIHFGFYWCHHIFQFEMHFPRVCIRPIVRWSKNCVSYIYWKMFVALHDIFIQRESLHHNNKKRKNEKPSI